MTASHIQILRAGPVQPIGLPLTAAMGVTNARHLHRRLLNNSHEVITGNNSLNLLGAKRCLFGSPEPGETQSLYIEEMKRNREHFIQRYSYDILADRFITDETELNNKSASVNLRDDLAECNHLGEVAESRLHEHQSGLDCTLNSTITPCKINCDKECNLDEIKLLTITKSESGAKVLPVSTADSTSTGSSQFLKDKKDCERLKPYSRQNLITEYYSTRKSATSITHAIDVSQLPTPQKAKLHGQLQEKLERCEDV